MQSTAKFEFFYDCSSPWTYFAYVRAIPMMERLGVSINWRPILVGGVFNAVNQQIYAAREGMFGNEARLAHYFKDMKDWSQLCGIKVDHPDVFPVNSVKAMRGAFFAEEQGCMVPYSLAIFEAYWGNNRDISQDTVLADIGESVGLEGAALLAATSEQRYKDALRANTEELIARGGYGSPTLFIDDDDMYFGNDRLPVVERRLVELSAAGDSTA